MTPPMSHVLAEVCPGFLAPAAGGQGRRPSASEACAQCAAADFRCRCNKDRESSDCPIPRLLPSYCPIPRLIPSYCPIPRLLPSYCPIPRLFPSYCPIPRLLPSYCPIPRLLPSYCPIPMLLPQLLSHTVQGKEGARKEVSLLPLLINCHINTDINTDRVCCALKGMFNRTYTATERATRADAAFCT